MELKKRCFSPARLKQLANFLVLVLSANILLESFSSNLLLARASNTRKFSQVPGTGLLKTAKTGLVPVNTVGATCDPTVTNSCGNGLQCDPSAKTCLLSVSNSCWNNPNSCAAGLNCDASTHLCCAPIGGSCLGEIDCCVINSNLPGVDSSASCQPQNGQPITMTTPGVCKLLPQADCSQAPHDCILGAVCGTSALNTQQTCCINPPIAGTPTSELAYTCQFDGDCCAGSLCDFTDGVNECVACLPAGHNCAGRTANCCASANLVCDPTGICVTASTATDCPLLGQACQQFGDCGGYNCNLVCDQTTLSCQLCGRLGTTCIGINSCCPTVLNGPLHCDIHNTKTCCVPQGAPCTLDSDCCPDAAGIIQCLAASGGSAQLSDVNLATAKICTLTQIYRGQLCGASLNSAVEPTANANTPCVQDDPYQRPVTCNLEVAPGTANLSANLCGISPEILISAGQPCADLTATIDDVTVTYNNCVGWDSNKDYAEAACLLTGNGGQTCCSLAGGACDPTHADNGNLDCCYNSLVCDATLQQCKYSGPTTSTTPSLLLTAGATNGWEIAAITLIVLMVLIASYAGYKYANRKTIMLEFLAKKLNAMQTIVQLKPGDVGLLSAVYPSGFTAKGCDPAVRKIFIDTLIELFSERMTNWSSLVTQSGISDLEFKANISLLLQLAVQQKVGEKINLPAITTSAATVVTEYFENALPDIMASTLRSMGVPELLIGTASSFAQPVAERKFNGMMQKVQRWSSTKMGADSAVVDTAITRQGLQAISDMCRGAINIINSDPVNAPKNKAIVTQLNEVTNFLERTIAQMPEGLPDSARGGVVNVDSPLNRAATAVMAEDLTTNIQNNPAMQRLVRPLMSISQAFMSDPVDFAKIYIAVLAQLMASEPLGAPITDAAVVAAIKFYLPTIFSPDAKLFPGETFATILQNGQFQVALARAGVAAGVAVAAIVPVFKSNSANIPLSLKRLILKINDYVNAETITQDVINQIDDIALETMLEVAVPLLNQVSVTATDGNSYPLMDLTGNVALTTDFGELAGLANVWA